MLAKRKAYEGGGLLGSARIGKESIHDLSKTKVQRAYRKSSIPDGSTTDGRPADIWVQNLEFPQDRMDFRTSDSDDSPTDILRKDLIWRVYAKV